MSDDTPSPLNNVITIDDERIKSHLERVARGTVEEAGVVLAGGGRRLPLNFFQARARAGGRRRPKADFGCALVAGNQ
jgi:hypothetical protein